MNSEKLILSSGSEHILMSISPDWPSIIVTGLIGIGSILTSIAVVKISRRNQKSQNKEKVAELRQQWLSELRDSMSKFVSIAGIISIRSKVAKDYHLTIEASEHHQNLLFYRTKIMLMLDVNKEYTPILKSLIEEVVENMTKPEHDSVIETRAFCQALEEQCQHVLEKAWLDIKEDLAA
ncbi:hypothetical protein BBB50_15440 [Vibrio cholerae 2740-80]|nr:MULTISPECIES: hypothetical protein [Vibrio]HAS2379922.1 hypothetical protein [Vibrio cholerae O1]ANR89068.1 hypothetical protein BBB50_15440 [Vibrio cholerae 2740-80]EGR0366669.1 hypothetical protein [Vibrio cholerae]EGR0939436.1 hypothetical protein [Vibrio cholerae]EGR1083711.1 hypothetical protein [Vibrio cholerae]